MLVDRLNGDAPCNLCGGVSATRSKKGKEVSDDQFAGSYPILKSPPMVSFIGGGSSVQHGMASHGGELMELCPDSFVRESGEGVWFASLVKTKKCTRGENDDEIQHLLKLCELNRLVDSHISGQLETPTKV